MGKYDVIAGAAMIGNSEGNPVVCHDRASFRQSGEGAARYVEGGNPVLTILQSSPATAKKHLENIFTKLGTENRASATLRALEVVANAR